VAAVLDGSEEDDVKTCTYDEILHAQFKLISSLWREREDVAA
jgi:hypothetical protein